MNRKGICRVPSSLDLKDYAKTYGEGKEGMLVRTLIDERQTDGGAEASCLLHQQTQRRLHWYS